MINFNKKVLNSNKFRNPAIHFQDHGVYCFAPYGTTEYLTYWDKEAERCVEGYTAPDGDWISGYNYFYLNYCPILRLVEFTYKDRFGNVKTRREKSREFPDFYDYDYYYFTAVQEAEEDGSHMCVLKSRGKGYSFKGGSMLDRNYYLIPDSKGYAIAAETEYLVRDGLLTKAWDYMDFIDEHTAWSKKRQAINTKMHRKASIITTDEMGNKIEVGYKSEIIGVSLKNDPNKARGKRGKLILWEEAGSFKDILQAWQIARPSVEEDGKAFGLMIAFGTGGDEGCITENNIVITEGGECKKISDITRLDKLIGFDIEKKSTSIEPVSHINIPTKKECLYIETNTGRHIECSTDHPIYSSTKSDYNERRIFNWNKAEELKLGNLVAVADDIPFFGEKNIFDPRLIGLLIGDGSYRKNSSVEITTCDDEIRCYIKNKYKTKSVSSYLSKEGKLVELFRVLEIKPEIHNLGINGQTKTNKRIPLDIFNSNKKSLCELLGGLYDTDGCVSTVLDKNRDKYSTTINLTQAGKEILQQVLILLNKLGIHGNISFNKGRISTSGINGINGFYKLDIRDKDSVINFHKNIKFLVKYKQDRLDSAIIKLNEVGSLRVDRGFRYEKIKSILKVGLKTIYNLTANNTNTYLVNGIITHNSRFDGLKEMFYNPSGYNIKAFPNIWDEGADGNTCAFFVPVYANMSVLDINSKRMFMDKNGNSLKAKAIDYAMSERQKVIDGSSDSRAIDRYIAENPITPQEAVLELTGNIFPKKELMIQLAAIRTNRKLQSHKQVGDLNYINGELNWTIKQNGDITKYPLGRDDKHEGSIVIWEHPSKDTSNQLYIAGCLTPGEKVLTNHGLKDVEKIDHNDLLINEKGEEVEIKVFQKRYKENCDTYRVTPHGSYRGTNFTGEHPLLIEDQFINAKDVSVGDRLKIPNRYCESNEKYITTIYKYFGAEFNSENPLFWWFLGCWLGDGFNNKNKNSHDIYVAFGKDQTKSALQFDNIIKKIFDRKTTHCKWNGGETRRFTSKILYGFLENEFGRYSYGKRIPEWVKFARNDLRKYFIAGYLDSDGSAFYDRGKLRVNFTSINLEMLESLQDMLYATGIFNTITRHSKKCISIFNGKECISKESYRLSIGRKYIKRIIPTGFEHFLQSEKMRRIIEEKIQDVVKTGDKAVISSCGKYIYLKIAKIEKSKYTGTVYNFECDTHTYMCRNITSHNCDPLTIWRCRLISVRIEQNR